jgi:membrane-associated phospholipid phosphatase
MKDVDLNSLKRFVLYGILPLCALIAVEPFYRERLFQKTLEDVPKMQQKKRLYGFFESVTALGEFQIVLVGLIIAFNVTGKMKALYIWAAMGFCAYVNTGIMKNLYAESRPFWVSEDIIPNKCRKEFGNPSGHCMISTFFWLTLYLHKYHEVGAKTPKIRSIFCTAYIIKMGLTIAMALFFLFLALSRVYLGEHSYNQVLFGSTMGLGLALVLHYFFKPLVKAMPLYLRQAYGINKESGTFIVPV